MVTGVDQLFTKTLIAEGVGYKFYRENKISCKRRFYASCGIFNSKHLTIKQEGPTKIIMVLTVRKLDV